MDTINLNKNVINLSKGEKISLSKLPAIDISKGGNGLKKVVVGLGWDPVKPVKAASKGIFSRLFGASVSSSAAPDIDCDAFALILKNDEINHHGDLIYYGNLKHFSGYAYHTGDNLTGDGEGDDEQIVIDLSNIDSDRIVIGVTIYQGRARNQDFGKLENAFIRICDMNTDTELCRYTLDDKYAGYVSVIFGELVKINGEWEFIAKGEAVDKDSIGDVARMYGY